MSADISPRSLSPEEPWRGWPENCRNFDPVRDNAREIRGTFCECSDCPECFRPEVVRVAEYDSEGNRLRNEVFDVYKLDEYLRGCDSSGPQFRVFFCCAHQTFRAGHMLYMRRLMSFCNAPVGVAHAFQSLSLCLGFNTFTATVTEDGSGDSNQTLHCWLALPLGAIVGDVLTCSEFNATPLRENIAAEAKGSTTVYCWPGLYLTYDFVSRQSNIVITGFAPSFGLVQELCSRATLATTTLTEDPFFFFVRFLEQLVNIARRTSTQYADRLPSDTRICLHGNPVESLQGLSNHLLGTAQNLKSVQALSRAIEQVKYHHGIFLKTHPVNPTIVADIESDLENQLALTRYLESHLSLCETIAQTNINVIMGGSQLRNGMNLYTVAQENQKQTLATERLGRETKRDSEVMKTITVVTLIYLPATFVCTLLSMEIFDFNSGPSGHELQIASQGWTFLALSIPLTFATLVIAYAWNRRQERLLAALESPTVAKAEKKGDA